MLWFYLVSFDFLGFVQDFYALKLLFSYHSYNEKWHLFLLINVGNFCIKCFRHSYSTLNPKPNQDILFIWVSPHLALLNVVWKMEGFSENETSLIGNEGHAMFLNEAKCEKWSNERNWRKPKFGN